MSKRQHNKPWKHIYGVDRKYTARVDRLRQRMSGEDQRHSYHEDEINELVDSRVVLEDGRIIEYPPEPADNPPNVIGGNNADQ